jgi:hypothetical protein
LDAIVGVEETGVHSAKPELARPLLIEFELDIEIYFSVEIVAATQRRPERNYNEISLLVV